jgi:drug/metabolite transporter (DMT)-like permease
MLISFVIAVFFFVNGKMETPMFELADHWQLVVGVVVTTIGWVLVTYMTKPSDAETLNSFNSLIFGKESKFKGFGMKILGFFAGVVGVYCTLFAIGNFIYSNTILAVSLSAVAVVCGFVIIRSFRSNN